MVVMTNAIMAVIKVKNVIKAIVCMPLMRAVASQSKAFIDRLMHCMPLPRVDEILNETRNV